MDKEVYAVLADARGIQSYVFSTNKMKLALGASQIVKSIYESRIKDVVQEMRVKAANFNDWKISPGKIAILQDDVEFEVGYIGGGNALLLFAKEGYAKEFIKRWTSDLLIYAPGLNISVVYSKLKISNGGEFDLKEIHNILSKEKNEFIPNTYLPKYGITADCNYTGLSAETVRINEDGEIEFVSSVAATKLVNSKLMEKQRFKEYGFPVEFDKLGQREGNSHIAVVHIDGNSIGKLFEEQRNISAFRKLSNRISEATEKSMEKVFVFLSNILEEIKQSGEFEIKDKILPIRVIIQGGDDITFVTDGRLGLVLAEEFIKEFSKYSVEVEGRKIPLSASAGVAIANSKYPFYRLYKLAEELCSNAKVEAHKNIGKSYIDFFVSYGGFFGELSSMREKYLTHGKDYKLYFGPYSINEPEDVRCLCYLKEGIKCLRKWPRSKVKELRDAIANDRFKIFREECNARELKLPDVKVNDKGFVERDGKFYSPYFDMVEMFDLFFQRKEEDNGRNN